MKNKLCVLCAFMAICVALSCFNLPFAFAENLHTISDNKRALPTDKGANVIAGKRPMYVDYGCGLDSVSVRDEFPTNEAIANGIVNDSWHHTAAKFADYNGGNPLIYENGEAFCNITFRLDKSTDVSGVCVINHTNAYLITAKYELHASKNLSYLYSEKSKIAEIDNTDGNIRQIVELSEPIRGANFFGIRVISPVQMDPNSSTLVVTEKTNNHYPRFSEVAVYGTEQDAAYFSTIENSCPKTDAFDDSVNVDSLDFSKGFLYGVKETITHNKSGTPKKGWGNNDSLTDGDLETHWYVLTMKFGELIDEKIITHRDEEDYYTDINFDAGEIKPLSLFYVKHHKTEGLRTLHYKIYAAKTEVELESEDSLIADCYNNRGATDNYFIANEDISARYYRLRVLDPCNDYSSKFLSGAAACNYAYPRFCEIAAFSAEDISGKLKFENFTVHGNAIGAVKPGTKVKSILNGFTGSGNLQVVDKNMNLKTPTDYLKLGDKVIVDTGFGNVTKGDVAFYCDLNSSGTYTVSDLVKMRNAVFKKENDFSASAGDTDCNGEVNATDVVRMLDAIYKGVKPIEDLTPNPDHGRKYGMKTDGVREVVVDTDVILNDNFYSLGTNSFASVLTPEATEAMGINKVYNELNKDRLAALRPKVSRMWFQIDWMITNTETDLSAENVENNADRLNYINGIYDFDSVWMQAFYQYVEMLREIDCQVEINFGWKTATRLKDWFVTPCDDFAVGAPKDLKAFAKASAALVKELRRRGFDNIKAIAFYNEPNGRDFMVLDADERVYWNELIKTVDSVYKEEGIRDTIELWGPEVAGVEREAAAEWYDYQLQHAAPYLDQWTGHHYYKGDNTINNYSKTYDTFLSFAEKTNRNFLITEFYGNHSNGSVRTWYDWDDSTISYLIAASNTGLRGALTWSSVGGYLPDPIWMKLHERDRSAWQVPGDEKTAGTVNRVFYEQSLFSNYVPYGSKVLYTDWTGDDVRSSAYLLPDGNVTVVVENNGIFSGAAMESGDDGNKTVKITINDGIDRTFKRISYIAETQKINAHATVNSPDKTIETENGSFTDTYGKFYSAHIYTTASIKKQVETDEVFHHVEKGKTAKLSAKLIDCEETDKIVYSITEATCEDKGSVDENGVYTAPLTAESGDIVAVRASLQSDPSVFAVNIIYVS